jgi:glycosyltransferase involved in cell wall biosynthesis
MAAGLPVIATRNSAIPEIVEHGVTGLLSPPYDEELFTKNIATLLTDHDLKKNMGITARQRALKFYDWNSTVEKYESILSEQSIYSS